MFLTVRRWLKMLSAAGEMAAWAIMMFWVTLIAAGVVARYVFVSPLIFQVDLASGLLVAFCTLCFGQLLVERSHIRVASLAERVPVGLQRWLWVATHALTAIYAVLVLASMDTLMRFSLQLGTKFDVSGMPLWPFQICVPIGFGLVAILALVECIYTLSPRWTPDDV
ncbi:TRAP transporter small permease (plasmid) [Thalassobaculum sp. OXR-137]|uniref:TRAP transporter small permease n=1 Tax=Thalassobaculum sp. OXR-137 TaxID=3100173 RepID=UPI002AC909A3|nr:TRAP transporter small permease [Thalassobaculum sp. OXR-137]WPZ37285.1 TRAP transporter small permease [Thalassobaculum sp. OXR-137]